MERTQIPFVRTPKGKGIMPDDHPLSAGAARTLALQQADVVFLMGARFNWILHFGLPPRYNPNVGSSSSTSTPRRCTRTSRPRWRCSVTARRSCSR